MRLIFVPLVLLLACAGSTDTSSREPPASTTYPPKMVKGETVDEDGNALDPGVRACVDKSKAVMSGIGNAISGQESSVDTSESDFGTCWCKQNGFRGSRMNGSCLP